MLQSITHTVEASDCVETCDDCVPSKKKCRETKTTYEWLSEKVASVKGDAHSSMGRPRDKECEKNRAVTVKIIGDVRVYDAPNLERMDYVSPPIDVCGLAFGGWFRHDPPAFWSQKPVARSVYAYAYEWDCCADPPKGTRVQWTITINNLPHGLEIIDVIGPATAK